MLKSMISSMSLGLLDSSESCTTAQNTYLDSMRHKGSTVTYGSLQSLSDSKQSTNINSENQQSGNVQDELNQAAVEAATAEIKKLRDDEGTYGLSNDEISRLMSLQERAECGQMFVGDVTEVTKLLFEAIHKLLAKNAKYAAEVDKLRYQIVAGSIKKLSLRASAWNF